MSGRVVLGYTHTHLMPCKWGTLIPGPQHTTTATWFGAMSLALQIPGNHTKPLVYRGASKWMVVWLQLPPEGATAALPWSGS